MNEYQKQLLAKYSYTSYTKHFSSTYKLASVASYVLLGISAIFSAKFFGNLVAGTFGEMAIYFGLAISCAVAYAIGKMTHSTLVYYAEQEMIEPMLGLLLFGLVSLNVYADYTGAPEWSYDIVGDAPKDEATSGIVGVYTPQIEAIDAEINNIEERNFYWCGIHNKAHKCQDANFYIDPKHDKKHVAKIEQLKAQKAELLSGMNGQLQKASDSYHSELSNYNNKLSSNQNRLRFGSLICTVLFALLQSWMLNYGTRFKSEINGNTATSGSNTTNTAQSRNNTPKRQKIKRVKAVTRRVLPSLSELSEDMPDIAEEIQAMKEQENQKRNGAANFPK